MSEVEKPTQRVMRKTSKEEIEKQPGKYDDDGFYLLDDGGFFDPNGYFFDKDGFDANGGKYSEEGVYVPGISSSEVSRSDKLVALSKEEILKLHPDGEEDEDGFYMLKDGDFFDPFGYYFDVNGFDVTGGSYDNQGYYRAGEERPQVKTREEIEAMGLEGAFDEDGFFILKDGDFYDPLGYYFDKHGFDSFGGHYDDQGYYIAASEQTRQQALTKEEVEKLQPGGSFDDDGFYTLKDGDYFDPLGYYFNADGLDANGGSYDDDGFYVSGKPRHKSMVPLTKAEVESQEGKYSDTGFFNLTKGGFYDPFGYYFNEAGLDAVGGCYEDGLYQDPDEEYKDAEDSYGDEAEQDYDGKEYDKYSLDELREDEALEREAIMNEHVLPAQLKAKQDRLKNKNQIFYLRLANLPDYFDDDDCQHFLCKQIPNFKQSKMVPISVSKDRSKFSSGNVLIKTRDIATVDKLLSLHGRWIDGYPLSCWLMGHEHLETDDYNLEFDLNELASYFSDTKPDKEESKQLNPESTQVTHDEEFEVTKIVRGKQTVTVEDEEFTITKKK